MKLSLVLLLLHAAAVSGSGTIEKRVVGSVSCKEARQYHVQIESVQPGKSCGGALINTRWVLTASHCAGQIVKARLGLNKEKSLGKQAKHFFKSLVKGTPTMLEQTIEISQQFTYKEEEQAHDIMLIKLPEDASPKLPTIALPPTQSCAKPEMGSQVGVGGWGAKKADILKRKLPTKLKCAKTEIVECGDDDKPGAAYDSTAENFMCGFLPGVETCFGDAGSAVEYNYQLYGIVVSNPVDKCASPIVMINICSYRKWIDETMRANP